MLIQPPRPKHFGQRLPGLGRPAMEDEVGEQGLGTGSGRQGDRTALDVSVVERLGAERQAAQHGDMEALDGAIFHCLFMHYMVHYDYVLCSANVVKSHVVRAFKPT